MSIVNEQLSSSSKFKITSQEITGTGSIGELPSYAMPTASLYMIQLEDSNVQVLRKQSKISWRANKNSEKSSHCIIDDGVISKDENKRNL